jgi:hypothetical protein
MTSYLTTFLSGTQEMLEALGQPVTGSRVISFDRGLARLTVGPKSSITMRQSALSSDQAMVVTILQREGKEATVTSYPNGKDFSLKLTVAGLAEKWAELGA